VILDCGIQFEDLKFVRVLSVAATLACFLALICLHVAERRHGTGRISLSTASNLGGYFNKHPQFVIPLTGFTTN